MLISVRTMVISLALSVTATSAMAQQDVRQTERLVKRAEDTVREIGRARAELQGTLEVYNRLMSGGADSKRLFSDLRKAANRSDDRRDDVRKRSQDMEKEAHRFFEEWTRSLTSITDPSLRVRSQTRLNDTRVEFGNILAAGRRASADFDVFLGGLRDQITYLGYDLNPDGIASLREDAQRLNASAESMFARIDDLSMVLSEHSGSLTAP